METSMENPVENVVSPDITLPQHEANSMHRAARIEHSIDKLKGQKMTSENVFLHGLGGQSGGNMGAAMGGGLGAGLLGGVLGGALLGNNGVLGNRNGNVDAAVTPAFLAASLADVTSTLQTSNIQQSLGDIKAAIPLAEGQVQLALAGATADINSNINTSLTTAVAGQAMINKNIADAIATSLASQNNINTNVLTSSAATREAVSQYGMANLNATKDSQFATQVAIAGSTKEILAALNEQNTANLQRQLAVAENALLEQRATSRAAATEVNVSQVVNQAQAQTQAQQQQQQQTILLSQLVGVVNGLQNAVATNSNMIIGNTGATSTGPQTANPVNVRA